MPGPRRPVPARRTTSTDQARKEEAREAKLADLHDRLAGEVRALSTGEEWKRWLRTAAKFSTYSFNNQLLIALQRPDATAVAGYRAWQARGRQVTKGEKGIAILAPVIRRASERGDDAIQTTGAEAVGADIPGHQDPPGSREMVGVRPAYVWDVSQTTGDPLPEPPHPRLLTGEAPAGLWDALASLAGDRGYTVGRGDTAPANGYTDFTTHRVVVRPDVDDAQAVKTLAHELGHVLLHDPHGAGQGSGPSEHSEPGRAHGRPEQEVEAESVAYLVAAAHGLDTDDYTFAYVAGWAAGRDATDPEQVVRDTARRVLSAATTVLAVTQPQQAQAVDPELAEHVATSTTATTELRKRAEATLATLTEQPRAAATDAVTTGRGTDPAVLLELHERAQVFYRGQLAAALADPACAAAAAVTARGLPTEVLDGFGVGYAPNAWTRLTDHLRGLGYSDEQLVDAGLGMRTRRGTVVDRFRNRIMFPVHDVAADRIVPDGRVIAYLGRSLDPAAGQDGAAPKYLNSPDTALYRKGEHLYGLGAPTVSAGLERSAVPVIVEGPWDALAVTAVDPSRHVGVAPGGTALTAAQVAQLDARVPLAGRGVVTAFDEDDAGARASVAAYPLLRAVGWPTYAPGLPGLDPSGIYARYGADVLAQSLDAAAARPLANRVTDARVRGYDLSTAEGAVGAARALARELVDIPLERAAQQLARATTLHGLSPALVYDAYRQAVDQVESAPRRGRDAPAAAGRSGVDGSPVTLAAAAYPAPPTGAPDTTAAAPAGHHRTPVAQAAHR